MIGTFVVIGVLAIIFYGLFYSMFEELVNRFWEEIDKIKRKLEEETEEAW